MLPCIWLITDGRGHCGFDVLMAGNLVPLTPTMPSWLTLPRLLRSKRVRPTTPTFLSEPEAPPPTKPVVYSPVPTWKTSALGASDGQKHSTYHQYVEGLHFGRLSGFNGYKRCMRREGKFGDGEDEILKLESKRVGYGLFKGTIS